MADGDWSDYVACGTTVTCQLPSLTTAVQV
jgi:hypothetical protein